MTAAVRARLASSPAPASVPRTYRDPATGQTVITYPDGTIVPVGVQEGAPINASYTPAGAALPVTAVSANTVMDPAGLTAVSRAEGAGAYPCDENYGPPASGGCVPADRDYDCRELHEMGIGDIPVIGADWMRLDGYQDFNTGQ